MQFATLRAKGEQRPFSILSPRSTVTEYKDLLPIWEAQS